MKNNHLVLEVSTIRGCGLLKIPQSKVDPYTRFSIGLLSGFAQTDVRWSNLFERSV